MAESLRGSARNIYLRSASFKMVSILRREGRRLSLPNNAEIDCIHYYTINCDTCVLNLMRIQPGSDRRPLEIFIRTERSRQKRTESGKIAFHLQEND